MLEKNTWLELIIYCSIMGFVFYVMLSVAIVIIFLQVSRSKITWENIKKVLEILNNE